MSLLALIACTLPANSAGKAAPADLTSAPGTVLTADVDWDAAREAAVDLLSRYLQVDTINPDGNETRGAEFLARWLAGYGIPSRIVEHAPGRGSLIARIPAQAPEEPPLCLLSHIDVATVEPDRWTTGRGPLSGFVDDDGVIWGRGALDMKGLGATQAMTLALVARHRIPLKRDLVLLAVSDEEVDNRGVQYVVDEHWGEIGCTHVINEGGVGIRDMFFDGQLVYTISVGEKGILWAHIVAEGEPGHGSTPIPDRAPERLMRAVQALADQRPEPRIHDSLYELLDHVGAHKGGAAGAVLKHPALVRTLLTGKLMGNPLSRAAVTDTIHVTGFGGAREPNVVPSEVWANLDSRLLPGTDPAAWQQDLLGIMDSEHVRLDVIFAKAATVTEWRGDPFYAALAARAVEGKPDAVAGPVISVGYTDSIVLREKGIAAFGFQPWALTGDEIATMHGDDERLSTDNLLDGVKIVTRAVLDVAGQPGGPVPPARQPLPWHPQP